MFREMQRRVLRSRTVGIFSSELKFVMFTIFHASEKFMVFIDYADFCCIGWLECDVDMIAISKLVSPVWRHQIQF